MKITNRITYNNSSSGNKPIMIKADSIDAYLAERAIEASIVFVFVWKYRMSKLGNFSTNGIFGMAELGMIFHDFSR